MCTCCGNIWCDPMCDSIAQRKLQDRIIKKLCLGCGENPDECRCKKKGPPDYPKIKRRRKNS
jgi:hypothetical protein